MTVRGPTADPIYVELRSDFQFEAFIYRKTAAFLMPLQETVLMGIRSRLLLVGSAALLTGVLLPAAQAQTNATIASATEVNANSHAFSFTSGAAGTESLTTAADTSFYYDSVINTSYTPANQNVTSSLDSFSATGGTTSSVTLGSNTYYEVDFSSLSGGIYQTSAAGAVDFLSFDFTAGTVTAGGVTTTTSIELTYNSSQPSSASFSVSSSESPAGAPGLDDYSSQIYNFTNPNNQGQYYTSESFSVNLQSVSPAPANSGSTLNSFDADGQFLFTSTPGPTAYPEPSSVALAVLGAGISFVPVLRRKRSAS